jgi:hypothetical protein
VDNKAHDDEFLGGNEDSIGNWTKGHSCCIMAKNLSPFYLYLETLMEVKFKSNGLINLRNEILR